MITDTYDPHSEPIIELHNFYTPSNIAEKAIVTFSLKAFEYVKEKVELKLEDYFGNANGRFPIYSFMHDGEKILFYMSPITAPAAGGVLDEVRFICGAKKFIVFGSCGALSDAVPKNQMIIPTEAYRDEGFSYHYAPASDYIKVKNSQRLTEIATKLGLPYVSGRTWTIDAMCRETVNNTEKRKADGCITVEMECSALQALCDYRNIDLYIFLFRGDLVQSSGWEKGDLGGENEKHRQCACFDIALQLVKEI